MAGDAEIVDDTKGFEGRFLCIYAKLKSSCVELVKVIMHLKKFMCALLKKVWEAKDEKD